jgi:single-strand DNA-binding protein
MSEHEINRVVVSGRLVSDPELRECAGATAVCVLRLASGMGSRVVGVPRERRDAINGSGECARGEFSVLVLGATARRVAPYLYAGRRVIVQGRLEATSWEAGEGPEREAVCVLAERIHFAGDAPRGAQTRRSVIPARAGDLALGVSGGVGFSEEMWC